MVFLLNSFNEIRFVSIKPLTSSKFLNKLGSIAVAMSLLISEEIGKALHLSFSTSLSKREMHYFCASRHDIHVLIKFLIKTFCRPNYFYSSFYQAFCAFNIRQSQCMFSLNICES